MTPVDTAPAVLVDPNWWTGAPGLAWMLPAGECQPGIASQQRRGQASARPESRAVAERPSRQPPLTLKASRAIPERTIVVSVWRGVLLDEGENAFVANITGADGKKIETLRRVIHYANTPVTAEYVPEQSALVADGIHRPVIAVRFLDKDGKPVRKAVGGAFTLNSPYEPAQLQDYQQRRALAGEDSFQPALRRWTATTASRTSSGAQHAGR